MSIFVDPTARTPVEDDQGNIIWIKSKMNIEEEGLYKDSLIRIDQGSGAAQQQQKKGKRQKGKVMPRRATQTRAEILHARAVAEAEEDEGPVAHVNVGSAKTKLLEINILDWEGPKFERDGTIVPCTHANIRLLNPTDPLVIATLEAIDEANKPEGLPDGEDGDEVDEKGRVIFEGNSRDASIGAGGESSADVETPIYQ